MILVNTPFSASFVLSQIHRHAKVIQEEIHMLIDMLVLPISNFDVVLGMN